MLDFVDEFYHKKLTDKLFNKYRNGQLSRKTKGYEGLIDEADDLFMRTVNFSLQSLDAPDWDRRELEIEILKALTFKEAQTWYRTIFNPSNALKGLIDTESYELYKRFYSDPSPNFQKEELKKLLAYEDFVQLAKHLQIKAEDTESAKDQCKEKMTRAVIQSFLEKIKGTQKNFLAIRIFAGENKDAMVDTDLEEKCRAGIELLSAGTYKTYLPKLDPDKEVLKKDFVKRQQSYVRKSQIAPYGEKTQGVASAP